MIRFLAGRLFQSAFILLGVTIITFGLLYLIPVDPARMIAGRSATPQTVESIRHQLGLDRPILQAEAASDVLRVPIEARDENANRAALHGPRRSLPTRLPSVKTPARVVD